MVSLRLIIKQGGGGMEAVIIGFGVVMVLFVFSIVGFILIWAFGGFDAVIRQQREEKLYQEALMRARVAERVFDATKAKGGGLSE
jgi:uncharacterized membrane protein